MQFKYNVREKLLCHIINTCMTYVKTNYNFSNLLSRLHKNTYIIITSPLRRSGGILLCTCRSAGPSVRRQTLSDQ